MTEVGSIFVSVGGRDVGLAQMLTALEARMRVTDAAGLRLGQTTGGALATNQQKAANSALGLAQAQARLAVAEGDGARAAGILNSALASNAGASERATLAVQTQAARLQSGTTIATQFGGAMKSSLTGIIGPAAAAGAAIGLLNAAIGQAEAGFKLQATLDASRASITALLRGVRDSSAVFAEGAAFAAKYGLTQAELNDTLQSSVGVMRASNASTTDLLETLSRLQVLAPEKPISEAARALRELQSGDTTSIKELFNIAAKDANKMKAEIQGGADAVATVAKFLDGAGVGMDALAIKTQGAAGKMRELAVANEQFQLALGGGAGGPGMALLEARITATAGATRLLTGDTQAMGQSLVTAADQGSGAFSVLAGVFPGLGTAIQQAAGQATGLQAAEAALTGEGSATAASLSAVAFAARDDAVAMNEASQAGAILATIQADGRRESILLAQASQESAIASQTDTQQKELETLQTQLLNAQNQAAVSAFLALNPNIDASGIKSAVAAGAISPLIGALAELTIKIRGARAELAAISGGAIGAASGVGGAGTPRVTDTIAVSAAAELRARNDQILALGTHAQKVALLTSEYARLAKQYGATSAQAIEAETKLRVEQQRTAGGGRGGAGGGVGGVKLTDQARLNNSLLANQAAADNKAEDAETEHQKKLLDIESDFAAKSLAQQRTNEVAKRQSKFTFYKSLADVEKNLGKDGARIAQEASAAYEQAFQESQKLAQAGQQKLAADRLALRQRQIQEDVQAASDIAKAKQDKDKEELAKLVALEALRKDAQAEELKQLEAGGDADVNAKTKALADEQQRFEEQQGKISTAAEQAAQRKITAAQQSGKAISDENTLLAQQEATLNRIGTRAPTAPGATPPPSVAPGAAGGATGVDLGALAGKLDAIVSAVNSAKDSIVGAEKDTARAVGGLQGRLVQ